MVFALRLVLTGMLVLAAAGKLQSWSDAVKATKEFGVRGPLVPITTAAVILFELLAAVLLLTPQYRFGAGIAGALLTLFSVALSRALALGRRPVCRCFGRLSRGPVSWRSLPRNALLLLIAVAVLTLPPSTGAPSGLVVLVIAFVAALAAQTVVLVAVLRQQGRMLKRLDDLERWRATTSDHIFLPFQVPLPTGIESSRHSGEAVALLFADHDCPTCHQTVPDVLAREDVRRRWVLVVPDRRPWPDLPPDLLVLVDNDSRWARACRVSVVPTVVLVDPAGWVHLPPATGSRAIHALLDAESVSREDPAQPSPTLNLARP